MNCSGHIHAMETQLRRQVFFCLRQGHLAEGWQDRSNGLRSPPPPHLSHSSPVCCCGRLHMKRRAADRCVVGLFYERHQLSDNLLEPWESREEEGNILPEISKTTCTELEPEREVVS